MITACEGFTLLLAEFLSLDKFATRKMTGLIVRSL